MVQAAALGGQLIAHCRREADLGLVTPQELLQSAQRQRCYLGYIPQPPQVSLSPYLLSALSVYAFHFTCTESMCLPRVLLACLDQLQANSCRLCLMPVLVGMHNEGQLEAFVYTKVQGV